jgi:hypothetical protein
MLFYCTVSYYFANVFYEIMRSCRGQEAFLHLARIRRQNNLSCLFLSKIVIDYVKYNNQKW